MNVIHHYPSYVGFGLGIGIYDDDPVHTYLYRDPYFHDVWGGNVYVSTNNDDPDIIYLDRQPDNDVIMADNVYVGGGGSPRGTVSGSEGTIIIGHGADEQSQPAQVGANQTTVPVPETRLDRAYVAFLQGEYAEAQKQSLQAMLEENHEGIAHLMYGLSSFAHGDYELAASAIEKAIQENDDVLQAPLDIRSLYADVDELETQINQLLEYRDKNPASRDAQFVLAYVLYAAELPERAFLEVNKLVQAYPYYDAYVSLATAVSEVIDINALDESIGFDRQP